MSSGCEANSLLKPRRLCAIPTEALLFPLFYELAGERGGSACAI
jgi:hypothetical protein